MTPIQQILLGAGGKKKKRYLDDVYKTFLYRGNNSSRTLNVGIDFTTDGGATFIKNRDTSDSWAIFDTVRGNGKLLHFNSNAAQSESFARQNNFSTTGFDVGGETETNGNNNDMSSFNLRKAKGFFDVVTWTGNGSNRTISHSLGSIPGMIIVKNRSSSADWAVYHRSTGSTKYIRLNDSDVAGTSSTYWNDTEPTAAAFSISTHSRVNSNGDTYVAYLFAGGESTAATARSVHFNGSNDRLTIPTHADLAFGTGDFTIECWVKPTGSGTQMIYDGRDNLGVNRVTIYINSDYTVRSQVNNQQKDSKAIPEGAWTHVAVTRSGTTARFFINGIKEHEWTSSGEDLTAPSSNSYIGGNGNQNQDHLTGNISNFRIVKGTAVYTTSFKPPTEPLTNITNTKLLCCNQSTTTGSTVSPTTIADPNTSTASIDSPFDDTSGFVYGDAGDQGVVKCGSYVGNGLATGPIINLGWEAQWLMVKNVSTGSTGWTVLDSMRGIHTGDNESELYANSNTSESNSSGDRMDLTATGFELKGTGNYFNSSGDTYIYIAIRRADGYVGKPVEAGTDVFAMDAGNGSSTAPAFDSGFPVDMRIGKGISSTEEWYLGTRFMYQKHVRTNNTGGDMAGSWSKFDYNNGEGASWSSSYQGWMWKRHAGFDVVCYTGNGNNTDGANAVAHSLGKAPEMIWIKTRYGGTYSGSTHWTMSHKGLNGGTNPWQYTMSINNTWANTTTSNFGNTAPTSTHFYVGDPGNGRSNDNGSTYIAMLFSSCDGISKVGTYSGSNVSQSITCGFQPRFVIIKNQNDADPWIVLDTTRGWDSNDDKRLLLNSTEAQSDHAIGAPISTGFNLAGNVRNFNQAGRYYIFYAHA